ncbi:MAG: class I SAM-dependent methyltransferase [Candidatus Aminicenantes bacterium]|nr:MAG: class I SAM-dependent methyltransferase [Candidatus Aminicenantes bacterium]
MVQKDRVYYRLRTHLEMLRDRVRCLAYQKAVESVVRDKIVLDVGCGTGILSFFAARAGARLVLAVDTDVPPGAEDAARANGLADRVQFFGGKIQDIKLPVDSVDIIVSEWMGGLLLMEDMLPVVLYARDQWLKPGGILLPDRARLFLAPLDDVAGISSKRFPALRETISSQMWVSNIDPARFLADPSCILDLDLNTIQEPDVKVYESAFCFDLIEAGILNGFGLWFDVLFSKTGPPVLLSTAPWLPPTHWGQGLWILPVDINVGPGFEISGTFTQTKVAPSTASFRANVSVRDGTREKTSFTRTIEASPSNMNAPGANEEHISAQAMSGAYQGRDCLWIGCSMSFGALMAARNGAKSVAILNHSSWADKAMQQLAAQEGLVNVRFLSGVPLSDQLQNKDICLLGAADSSWQALLSHIRVRRNLGRASFLVRFCWQESSWKQFYGFDFSAYGPHDLEMYQEDRVLADGMVFRDITGQAASPGSDRHKEEIIYTGVVMSESYTRLNLPEGRYNCVRVGFDCGTVVLPLSESLYIDSSEGKQVQRVELTISVINEVVCRFGIMLSCSGWSFRQRYEQLITSMGHIVRS